MTDKKEQLDIWQKACAHLQQILAEDVYQKWIAVIGFGGIEAETVRLSVSNDFYLSWLEENYLPIIKTALATVTGEHLHVELTVDRSMTDAKKEDKPEPRKKPTLPHLTRKNEPAQSVTLNPNYTFESFVIGNSNNFAHAAAMAVAQAPSKSYNPLFIHGATGLGKTHLMQAIGNHVFSRHPRKKIVYLSCEDFVNEFVDALREHKLTKFRKKYRNVDVLLIDDIHFLIGKQQMQEEFFHTFNALFQNHKQIVLTCDRPASELSGLTPRLISRFEWGLVTELSEPDIETRIAILRNKTEALHLSLPDELLQFLAERISSNVRRLEGALVRVASYVSLTGRELDHDGLQHLLRDMLDEELLSEINIESIQRIVADHFDVQVSDILGKKRPQHIAWPRQVAMYLSRDMTDQSLPNIGSAFGRNHATVLHAHKQVSQRMNQDESLQRTIKVLKQRIGNKTPTL